MENMSSGQLTPANGNSFGGIEPQNMLQAGVDFARGMAGIANDFIGALTFKAPEIENSQESTLDNLPTMKPSFARGMRG